MLEDKPQTSNELDEPVLATDRMASDAIVVDARIEHNFWNDIRTVAMLLKCML